MNGKTKTASLLTILLLPYLLASGCLGAGISSEDDSQLIPSHPGQVSSELNDNSVLLKWLGTGDDRISYYQIYRKSNLEDWQRISKVMAEFDNRGMYEFRDENIDSDITYIYGVSAINIKGKESVISESPSIFVP